MVQPSLPPLRQFYSVRSVFVTGGTGIVGRALVTKLLLTCHDIEAIYVLVRPRNGKQAEERISESYGSIPTLQDVHLNKIHMVSGDLLQDRLGLSQKDRQHILESVSVVFHSAATTRLNGSLYSAMTTNVFGLERVLELAKEMPKLDAFVHVSTAYAHTNIKAGDIIEETIYDTYNGLDIGKLMEAFKLMPANILNNVDMTKRIIGTQPNTYTFTKALGELLVWREKDSLPIAIVRPSIVSFPFKDAMAGHEGTYDLPQYGVQAGVSAGLLHSALTNRALVLDAVPVDVVANQLIAAAWHIARADSQMGCSGIKLPIFNCTMDSGNPISRGDVEILLLRATLEINSRFMIWYPSYSTRSNKAMHYTCDFLFHKVPAIFIDFAYCQVIRRLPFMRTRIERYNNSIKKGHPQAEASLKWFFARYEKRFATFRYFTDNEWLWNTANANALEHSLCQQDREMFPLTMRSMDYSEYSKRSQKIGVGYGVRNGSTAAENPRIRIAFRVFQVLHIGAMLLIVCRLLATLIGFLFED